MLAVIGTVPDAAFPMTHGPVQWTDDRLHLGGREIEVDRGTPALLAAALAAANAGGGPGIYAFLAGDIGRGTGSRELYRFLSGHLHEFTFRAMIFHYLQPDADGHSQVLFAVDAMAVRPAMIADAGFMYAAKMSGQAPAYDLFTPDAGELAFLADEKAPHPFYTRGFILHDEQNVPDLIQRAYRHENAARYLLVKGRRDCIASSRGIHGIVDHPAVAAMEAMGGTGDTLSGIAAALIAAGMNIPSAALLAARTNRLAGQYADLTPASRVLAVIRKIPEALAAARDGCQRIGGPMCPA